MQKHTEICFKDGRLPVDAFYGVGISAALLFELNSFIQIRVVARSSLDFARILLSKWKPIRPILPFNRLTSKSGTAWILEIRSVDPRVSRRGRKSRRVRRL